MLKIPTRALINHNGPVAQPGRAPVELCSEAKVGVILLIRWSRVRISSGPFTVNIDGAVTKQKMKKPKFKVDKHTLTPKHAKLGEREKTQLLERYHVTSKELPKISKADAAIRELEPKPGDIIKVTRKSQTAGESFFYRVVSDV